MTIKHLVTSIAAATMIAAPAMADVDMSGKND
jgi:hypothetical protein